MKVWMVWQNIESNAGVIIKELEGVYDSESKAQTFMNQKEVEWRNDAINAYGEVAEEFDSPFFIEFAPVQ